MGLRPATRQSIVLKRLAAVLALAALAEMGVGAPDGADDDAASDEGGG